MILKDFYTNFKNSVDFFIRKHLKISRGSYCAKNEAKIQLFSDYSPKLKTSALKKENLFFKTFKLESLKNNSTQINYCENLYIIDLLDSFLNVPSEIEKIKVLDIGSKNWYYARGEYNFFKYKNSKSRNICMDGIEIDANRLYSNFYSRKDYALFFIKDLENTRYLAKDLLGHNEKYDYITWFFPFLTSSPLLAWGLPLKELKPEKLIKHAYSCLNKDGQMIITNQGIEEYKIQHELLNKLGITYSPKGKFSSVFMEYEFDRYVTLIEK